MQTIVEQRCDARTRASCYPTSPRNGNDVIASRARQCARECVSGTRHFSRRRSALLGQRLPLCCCCAWCYVTRGSCVWVTVCVRVCCCEPLVLCMGDLGVVGEIMRDVERLWSAVDTIRDEVSAQHWFQHVREQRKRVREFVKMKLWIIAADILLRPEFKIHLDQFLQLWILSKLPKIERIIFRSLKNSCNRSL